MQRCFIHIKSGTAVKALGAFKTFRYEDISPKSRQETQKYKKCQQPKNISRFFENYFHDAIYSVHD